MGPMNHQTGFCRFVTGIAIAALFSAAAFPAQAPSVVINEFVASNHRGLTDGDGNASDWIELYNAGSTPVALDGWHLTDDRNNLRKWSFPPQTILPAGTYLVVFASGQAATAGVYIDRKGYLHTNFSLDKEGEYLALVTPSGIVVHEYAPRFPPQQADISYGLWQGEYRYFTPPTPGQANGPGFLGLVEPTSHSRARGFCDQPFTLRISCGTTGAQIRYTLDGSEPTEQHGIPYNPGTSIAITTTTVLRSAAFKTGWKPASATTHTYVFAADVARQPTNPPGWPSDWGYDAEVHGTVPADYAMDPRVVNSTLPGYSVREALLDIPTVSVSMLPDDFISRTTGIWANPLSRWERKCSVEYILPKPGGQKIEDGGQSRASVPARQTEDGGQMTEDGEQRAQDSAVLRPPSSDLWTEGFQQDCKIETHGGSSRRPWRMQKHSLRLTFTSQYGPAKLHYPLFPGSDIDEFNQLILRGGFCDSWALVSWDASRYRPNDAQYLRDTWMKESLRDMGQPSSSSSFVHLYVNGLYFGLYNLSERVAEDFMADHLGGQPEDWEINGDFATPGARWRAMMALDPSTRAGYTLMQQYLDVENLADYVLLHLYADAEDWPHHNGYAAANATSGDGKFRFFAWDQEIVLDYHGRAAERIDNANGAGAVFQKMRTSEEFRLLFADRVYKHCFNDGALSVATSQDRYRSIASWIDKALVAESARWGDVKMTTPYGSTLQQPSPLTDINHIMYPPVPHGPNYYFTREDSWVVERDNVIHNYIPAIHNPANSYALIPVLRAENLYPDLDPPTFYLNGVPQHGGQIAAGARLAFVNPNGRGTIYYTLDGSDPRIPGATPPPSTSNAFVSEQAAKRVLVPAREIGQAWRNALYDDALWISGTGGVGYERDSGYEPFFSIDIGPRMYGVNTSCYIRIPFALVAQDLQNVANLILKMRYDDGFAAYLNGVEVARDGFAGTLQWNSAAASSRPDAQAVNLTSFNITTHVGLLRPGDNILALHGLNASKTDSDFLISAELVTAKDNAAGNPGLSPNPIPYTGPIPLIETTHIKARVLDKGQWSASHEAVYETPTGFIVTP